MPEGTAQLIPRKAKSSKAKSSMAAAEAMFDILSEMLPVYARIKAIGTRDWTGSGPHPGVRFSFLRLLKIEGPMTVPQVARSRGVARQQIQKLANTLADEGLIEFVNNPEHRRSKLLCLLPAGEEVLTDGEKDVKDIAKGLSVGMDPGELATTAQVLSDLYVRLGVHLSEKSD